jgi:tripartite-type tricarboxylate transporter receptor subunit TctC
MRRKLLAFGAALSAGAVAAWLPRSVGAQSWPDRPITIVVPFPPGAVDALARLIGTKASAALGQPFVYRNVAGAGQRIGTEQVARAPRDGYTLGVVTTTGFVVGPVLASKASYDPLTDFTPITMCTEAPYLLVARADAGVRSVADLIARAKAQPEALRIGSAGIGSAAHLMAEQLMAAAGIRLNHVPYKGEAPVITDLVGGQIDVAFATTAGSRAQLSTGKLVVLGLTAAERSPAWPDVPTLKEGGASIVVSSWLGFVAPAGIPAGVRERLLSAFSSAARDPEVAAAVARIGSQARELSGDAFAAQVRREVTELRELNKSLKLALD